MLCSKKHFLGGLRVSNSQLWKEYVLGKQNYSQLAFKYDCFIRSIQRKLDKYKVTKRQPEKCPLLRKPLSAYPVITQTFGRFS
jgi:hypothetical protein